MASLDGIDTVILAGGRGTRLRSALPERQKVMATVGGRPFLAHVIDFVHAAGVRRIVLALGYRAEDVTAFVERCDRAAVEIVLSVEQQPLGTGGALRHALPHLWSQTVAVLNGDSMAGVDLAALLDFHRRHDAVASVALVHVPEVGRYGLVHTMPDDAVIGFEDKPHGHTGDGHINAGIYVVERRLIKSIPTDRAVSLEREVFRGYCGRGLYGMKQDVPFIDIGTPESWRAADIFMERHQLSGGRR